jgi:hypothetical protein
MKTVLTAFATAAALAMASVAALAQSASGPIPVTVDNYVRAETDKTFAGLIAMGDGIGKFHHNREMVPVDVHVVQRGNRDTLYSTAVVDLDAGPVTITLPDAGTRFMTMIFIDEDHYVHDVMYGRGTYAMSKDKIGTRYALAAVRILVDPNDPKDVEQVHRLQDRIQLKQPGGSGTFAPSNWDEAGRKKIADALTVLGETLPDWRGAAGPKGEVDPIRHLIVTATGWGLNPDKDAIYLNVTPKQNDGKTVHTLTVKDVPVDGFWSISLYSAQGYFEKNAANAYSLNNITAKKNPDASVTVQFGGCDGKIPNCLPTVPGWNYMVRLYRPRAEILNGRWTFPEARPAN